MSLSSENAARNGLNPILSIVVILGLGCRVVGDPFSTKPGQPGPQGPAGDSGEPGKPGTDGQPGEAGEAGAPGQDGADGVNGVDGVSCSAAPVSDGIEITCGDDAPVLIPNSDPGEPGGVGPQGPTGAPGIQGEPGLGGEPGPAGPQGDPGEAGTDGQQGAPGADGQPGTDGNDGLDGVDGSNSILGVVDPCGDYPDHPDTILIRVLVEGSGDEVGEHELVWWQSSIGLIRLMPGTYRTTDRQRCRFEVTVDGGITNEHS